MEIVVTSYKDLRKSPCEVAMAFLRICFESLPDSSSLTCYLMNGSAHQQKCITSFLNKQKRLSLLEVSSVDAFVYDAIQAARCLSFTKANSGQQCCKTKAFSSLFCMRVYFCTAQCRLKHHYFCFVHDGNFLVREVSCICITCDYNRHQRAPDMLVRRI